MTAGRGGQKEGRRPAAARAGGGALSAPVPRPARPPGPPVRAPGMRAGPRKAKVPSPTHHLDSAGQRSPEVEIEPGTHPPAPRSAGWPPVGKRLLSPGAPGGRQPLWPAPAWRQSLRLRAGLLRPRDTDLGTQAATPRAVPASRGGRVPNSGAAEARGGGRAPAPLPGLARHCPQRTPEAASRAHWAPRRAPPPALGGVRAQRAFLSPVSAR